MMKQEDLFKKLGLILNELNDQYQFLAQNPQQLNELELELFHANANFLADHVQIIKKINANQQAPLALASAEENVDQSAHQMVLADDMHEQSQVEEITFADEPEEEPLAMETEQILFDEDVEEPVTIVDEDEVVAEKDEPLIHFEDIEKEVFKIDNEPSTFEFILNDHSESESTSPNLNIEGAGILMDNEVLDEKFDFEEKSVDEIFNRPLSEEEEQILAQKAKLRAQHLMELPETVDADDDEIGPEPFLVHQEEPKAAEEELEEPKAEEAFPIEKEDLELEVAPITNINVNPTEPVEDPSYKPTLNDLLAKTNGSNINSTAGTAVKDLKQAINLNDKLLYIKDLFNGYNLAYAEAIDFANKLPNFEAADNFFQKNYAVKNNWSEKQATVDKFYSLLNQRFKTPNP
ncbi:MAG: hypothetical protein EOP00_10165 [Pedobacter sp.]|nr:MAG: hypothetical protein EOP00_10165 [Pedobacter sp.]